MSLSDRDRKMLLAVVPVALLVAYWFLLLSPQRKEAQRAADDAAQQVAKRDKIESKVGRVEAAKKSFASDYAELIRLGKAVPSRIDMPSLIVQLDAAARGTGIHFTKIKTGERSEDAGAAPAPSTGSSPSSGSGSKPVDAGGASAQSAPGSAVEGANNASATSDKSNAAAEKSGTSPGDTQTATSSKQGGLPVGGAAGNSAGGGQAGGPSAPGLDSVPLEFQFDGSFFDLADFFHRLKRFVHVTNKRMLVRGRLMTIDSLKFATAQDGFPKLTAEVKATVWLAPKTQGTSGGATASGPATTPAASASGSSGPGESSTSSPTPSATATAP